MCRNFETVYIEESPSGQAQCRKCYERISCGVKRAVLSWFDSYGYLQKHYYHPECAMIEMDDSILRLEANKKEMKKATQENALALGGERGVMKIVA